MLPELHQKKVQQAWLRLTASSSWVASMRVEDLPIACKADLCLNVRIRIVIIIIITIVILVIIMVIIVIIVKKLIIVITVPKCWPTAMQANGQGT